MESIMSIITNLYYIVVLVFLLVALVLGVLGIIFFSQTIIKLLKNKNI